MSDAPGTPDRPSTATPSIPVLFGGVVWAILALLSLGPLEARLGTLELVFLLAPCVIVPLGFGLLDDLRSGAPDGAQAWITIAYVGWPVGLGALVLAMLFAPGALSGILALGWLGPTWIAALAAPFWVGARRSLRAIVLVPSVALLYLAVGAGWFVAWRFGWRPLDLSDVIVALTAVHFHVAGFGALVLAWILLRRATPGTGPAALAAAAGIGGVLGMPLTAAGFTFDAPFLSAVGAIVLGVSLLGVAALTLGRVRADRVAPVPAMLLAVSSLSVVVGMALAIRYALGEWSGDQELTIARMVEVHGVANGLGFVTLGLFGWSLARGTVFADPPEDRELP